MYLKSLTIKGFKSFALRSQLLFDNGLCVIVGPNGSGKSNVADAIRWVLGEQSAKQLRGASMEDVIFAGSSTRKACGLAEVDLVLDNSDHVLPIDFAEVALTRRMSRTSESEYLINAAPARLLDVYDILHDSGLGKDARSVISQGKLDTILAAKPDERRLLIEEAAGISKHKRRRERAAKRLQAMEAHVERAKDIQHELTRRLKPLDRQRKLALRAEELEARLRHVRLVLLVDDLRGLQARHAQLTNDEIQASSALDLAELRLEERSRSLDHMRTLLEEKGLTSADISARKTQCFSLIEHAQSSMRVLDEKKNQMNRRVLQLGRLIESAEASLAIMAEQTRRSGVDLDETRTALRSLQEAKDKASSEMHSCIDARKRAQTELDELERHMQTLRGLRDRSAVAMAKFQDSYEHAQAQDDLFTTRLESLCASSDELSIHIEQTQSEIGVEERKLQEAEHEHREVKDRLDTLSMRLNESRDRVRSCERSLLSAKASIEALRAGFAHSDSGLAARVSARQTSEAAKVRIREIFSTSEELEPPVEALLGDVLSGFVPESPEEFERLYDEAYHLSQDEEGSVYIVSPDLLEHGALQSFREDTSFEGCARRLLDCIEVSARYASILEAYLGDVWVVESPDEAVRLAQKSSPHLRFVSSDGRLVTLGSCLKISGSARGQGLLERQRTLRDLETSLPGLQDDFECALHDEEIVRQEEREQRSAYEEQSVLIAQVNEKLRSLRSELARSCRERDRLDVERQSVERTKLEGQERAAQALNSYREEKTSFEEASQKLQELEADKAGRVRTLDDARRSERTAHDTESSVNLEVARMLERLASLERSSCDITKQQSELERNLCEYRRERGMLSQGLDRTGPLRSRLDCISSLAHTLSAQLAEKSELAEADSDLIRTTIAQSTQELSQAQEYKDRVQSNLTDIRLQKAKLEVQVENAVNAIISQPSVILEEALELPAPADRGSAQRELTDLEQQLSRLGPVNQVASLEYEDLSRRSAHLNAQLDDLTHAYADLKKILAAIDRKMRSRFMNAFECVNHNFSEIFALLFPGGAAHLEMTDTDDYASCGIEVIAQPQGKRVSKMSLLSGGERSLCALGLLFAVYRTRGVPFYVLDEVDAALDDSNLDRFLAALDSLRSSTQFIVITHQRRTMEHADVLYGVSMKHDGVSRVISQRLKDASSRSDE